MQTRTQNQNRIKSTDENTCKKYVDSQCKTNAPYKQNANQSCKKKHKNQKRTLPNPYQGRTLMIIDGDSNIDLYEFLWWG